MDETRMWRLANTAQWVAWGIVQAKVPGMPLFDGSNASSESEGEYSQAVAPGSVSFLTEEAGSQEQVRIEARQDDGVWYAVTGTRAEQYLHWNAARLAARDAP